jgi:hypothetical protein
MHSQWATNLVGVEKPTELVLKRGLARPKPLNYSSGCPAQASLGRGCSVVTEHFTTGN